MRSLPDEKPCQLNETLELEIFIEKKSNIILKRVVDLQDLLLTHTYTLKTLVKVVL